MPSGKKRSSTSSMDSDYTLRTLGKKRTTNFREDETKLLISLWGSPVIQNKLYLTHRKAPVMRILAAHMQQRGFHRTPDEIKTRIRNLKCLYHRIKRTMVTGSGIGTVDPDWPHFKAMDAILGKPTNHQNQMKEAKKNQLEDSLLEGPRCEDIKQEIDDDLDIKDDMESWPENDSGTDYEDNHIPAAKIPKSLSPPAAPVQVKTSQFQPILPNLTAAPSVTGTATTGVMRSTTNVGGTIPLPLLILNHAGHVASQQNASSGGGKQPGGEGNDTSLLTQDISKILREMVQLQKQQFEIEKQRFEIEKQRLEFDRVVGSQLMTLVPMVGGLLQRLVYPQVLESRTPSENSFTENNEADPKTDGNKTDADYDILKDSKILRTVLERGIKKYMMSDETRDSNKNSEDNSDNEDSGLNQSESMIIDTNENSCGSNK